MLLSLLIILINYYVYLLKLFGDVCYHCNRVIEGDGEY